MQRRFERRNGCWGLGLRYGQQRNKGKHHNWNLVFVALINRFVDNGLHAMILG
jgi:hypothetical protein